jgi:hypothetical protein
VNSIDFIGCDAQASTSREMTTLIKLKIRWFAEMPRSPNSQGTQQGIREI